MKKLLTVTKNLDWKTIGIFTVLSCVATLFINVIGQIVSLWELFDEEV